MCNLYNISIGPQAILELTRAMMNRAGNLEPGNVYPDYPAPIVRNGLDGERERELVKVRWGMPSSKQALFKAASARADKLRAKGKPVDFDELLRLEPDRGTTNVRRTDSKHWKPWLGVESRCVVPFSRFAEPHPEGGNAWFAVDKDQPLAFFAGIWCSQWRCVRKIKEGELTLGSVRLPHDRSQRHRWPDPPQGHAGDPYGTRRDRDVADVTVGRCEGAAATAGG